MTFMSSKLIVFIEKSCFSFKPNNIYLKWKKHLKNILNIIQLEDI